MKQSFKTKLRQLWFPAEFRLPEPEFTKEQLDLLEELIQLIQPTLSQEEKATRDERISMARFLIDLGTGVWRIRRKIEGLSRMPKEIKDALYSLESTWASMSEGGVEIVDHLGAIPLKNEAKVVEVREIPNLTRDQVIETVRPTIMFKGEVIQVGEVVMGRAVKPGIPSPSRRAVPAMAEETRENLENEPEFPEGQDIQPEAPETDEAVFAGNADEKQDLPDELETAAPREELPPSDEAEAGEGPAGLESAPPAAAEILDEHSEPDETRAADEASAHGEALPEAVEESAEFIESPETAATDEIPGKLEATSESVPDETETEAKPKKKRAPRKAKAPRSEEAEVTEEPKPKRARKSKKKAEETTEVNDAG